MSINKIQYLTPFLKIYKKMKVVIIENLYFQLNFFNGNIGYIKNIALKNIEWI
jgi:ATP-dependent exoDNAse (exonuclease V) alpha subunit